jgi:hypothetical protein
MQVVALFVLNKKKMCVNAVMLFSVIFSNISFGQSSFKTLSAPEKKWVLLHPFKAKKAQKITFDVQLIVDSIRRSEIIGKDNNGGALDAFKHSFWMASLAIKIGKKQALKLGMAHEKANYLEFKKKQMEDAVLPDSLSSVMDLKNNESGVFLVNKNEHITKNQLINKILEALAQGRLTIIKKDQNGNFIDCNGSLILMEEWMGKWNIPKCLVPSF